MALRAGWRSGILGPLSAPGGIVTSRHAGGNGPHVEKSVDLVPWALVVFALLVRTAGIGWGLPEVFEEAYPLKTAMRMHGLERLPPTLDPGFFRYPSLVIDVQYAV